MAPPLPPLPISTTAISKRNNNNNNNNNSNNVDQRTSKLITGISTKRSTELTAKVTNAKTKSLNQKSSTISNNSQQIKSSTLLNNEYHQSYGNNGSHRKDLFNKKSKEYRAYYEAAAAAASEFFKQPKSVSDGRLLATVDSSSTGSSTFSPYDHLATLTGLNFSGRSSSCSGSNFHHSRLNVNHRTSSHHQLVYHLGNCSNYYTNNHSNNSNHFDPSLIDFGTTANTCVNWNHHRNEEITAHHLEPEREQRNKPHGQNIIATPPANNLSSSSQTTVPSFNNSLTNLFPSSSGPERSSYFVAPKNISTRTNHHTEISKCNINKIDVDTHSRYSDLLTFSAFRCSKKQYSIERNHPTTMTVVQRVLSPTTASSEHHRSTPVNGNSPNSTPISSNSSSSSSYFSSSQSSECSFLHHSNNNNSFSFVSYNHPIHNGNNNNKSSSTGQSSNNGKPKSKPRRRVATVAQRRAANIRERRRMFNLNSAFDKLRKKVPTFAYEKRLSRIETLRLAIMYISFMSDLLESTSNGEPRKLSNSEDLDLKKSPINETNENLIPTGNGKTTNTITTTSVAGPTSHHVLTKDHTIISRNFSSPTASMVQQYGPENLYYPHHQHPAYLDRYPSSFWTSTVDHHYHHHGSSGPTCSNESTFGDGVHNYHHHHSATIPNSRY